MLGATQPGAAVSVSVSVPAWGWGAFVIGLGVLLLVDVLVLHREAHVPSFRRAVAESSAWIAVGVGFGILMLSVYGGRAGGEYFAGYLIEKSLSVDNVFVWALLLRSFAVPREYQHRVLFWGVFAALALRAAFIFGGVELLDRFEWILYLFGAFLLYTAVKVAFSKGDESDPNDSRLLRFAHRVLPSTDRYDGQRLFTLENGRRLATPLLFVLIVVEVTDLLFAVDSVPAILAVSRDQFIVFASNALAILGLRSLYFLLADLHDRFRYLQQGLGVILAFVGVKMLLSQGVPDALRGDWTPGWLSGLHMPIGLSLGVIAGVLTVSITASLARPVPSAACAVSPTSSSHAGRGSDPS